MYLKELQKNWDIFGQEDALWAVCTAPEKKNNKWDTQEFFQTGVQRISQLRQWMDDNGLPKQRKSALDFGCGVGRLTQALCDHFDTCVGVDIAPSMIEKAKGFNRHGWKCIYRLNEQADLRAFQSSSFDLINTEHVLQHIRPEVALRYIAEFVRILKPGGLAYFHCPSQASTFAYPEDGIQCTLDAPATPILMETGTVAEFPVTVTNTGGHPIGTGKTVNAPAKIIHHWVELNTDTQHRNHGYLNLPAGVIQPGGTMTFDYKAASPQGPGEYALVLTPADFFNKGIGDTGSAVSIPVLVTPRKATSDAPAVSAERPQSESHVLPERKVEAMVEAAGGRMVEIIRKQNDLGGRRTSYYYVTR
jgi:SAM-dependent methyltransferase